MNFKEYYLKRHNIRPVRGGDLYVFYGPNGLIKTGTNPVKVHAYTAKQAVFKFKKFVPNFKFIRITAQPYDKYLQLLDLNKPKPQQTPIQKSVQKAAEEQLKLNL